MTMTISEALCRMAKLVHSKGESFEDAQAWDTIRSRLEVSDEMRAFQELVEACEAEFVSADTETMEPDESKVSYPEDRCHITFGHIRRARAALVAALGE